MGLKRWVREWPAVTTAVAMKKVERIAAANTEVGRVMAVVMVQNAVGLLWCWRNWREVNRMEQILKTVRKFLAVVQSCYTFCELNLRWCALHEAEVTMGCSRVSDNLRSAMASAV